MLVQQTGLSDARAAIAERIRAAQALVRQERTRGLDALNELFRTGWMPDPPLDGPYAGELVALAGGPLLARLSARRATGRLPWQGKTFDAVHSRGDNIFTRSSLERMQRRTPGYRGFMPDGPDTYRAFAFRTYVGPGRLDRDRQVLKIDYDLPENPRWTIRRVLDELGQVGDGLYLGKAHFHWWWGTW